MSIYCMLRNSLKQIKFYSAKNVLLQNQLKQISCTTNLTHILPINNRWNNNCSAQYHKLDAVRQFGTSPVLKSGHGDHSKIWTAERLMSGAMLVVLPAAIMMPSQAMDTIMALTITMHMHWGIEAVVIDYVRPIIFGPVIPKVSIMLVYVMSIATLAGLLNFIFNDVGLANGIKLLWKL